MPIDPSEDERVDEVSTRYETLNEQSKEAVRRLLQENGVRRVRIMSNLEIDELRVRAFNGRPAAKAIEIMYDAGLETFIHGDEPDLVVDGYLDDRD